MAEPKQGKNEEGKFFHYSVGAIIKRADKYLLIDRAVTPFGFAGPAGHIDEGETPEEAIVREVYEETGLTVTDVELLFAEFNAENECSKGVRGHYWYVYDCEYVGDISRNHEETKSIGWFSIDDIRTLKLEPVWEQWFGKLGII